MKNYRLGNTITIKWTIMTATGTAYNLNASNLELFAVVPNHTIKIDDFSVAGNVVTWTFLGTDQKFTGPYTLTLIENRGQSTMMTVDYCNAFGLVRWSCQAGWDESADVNSNLSLTSEIFTHQIALSKEVQDAIDGNITEYNVSNHFPTDGIDGTNRYTLETAIAKIPASLRTVGIKCSFLNEAGQVETWENNGKAWVQVGAEKITKIESLQKEGYLFAGIATPDTKPAQANGKVYYLATQPGVYTNFGNLSFSKSHLYIIFGNNGTWSLAISSNIATIADTLILKKTLTDDTNVLSDPIDVGTYTFNASSIAGLPEGFSGYGWLVVIHENLRILFGSSDSSKLYIKNNNAWIDFSIIQPERTTGTSNSKMMSQKAVTDNLLILKGSAEDATSKLTHGIYTCSSSAQNLPPDFPANAYGWIVVFNETFRLLFLQNEGDAWGRWNDGKWHNLSEMSMSKTSAGIQVIGTKLMGAVNNKVFDLKTEEISADEIIEGAVISMTTGKILTTASGYVVKKYNVTGARSYKIISSTQFRNALFSVFDKQENLLDIKVPADSEATVGEDIYITPANTSYILVGYSTSITEGGLYDFEIIPYKQPPKWSELKWIVVGDSLTEVNDRTTKHYYDYIAERTGIQVTNMGVSGTGYKRGDSNSNAFYQRVNSIPTDADVITIFGSFNDLGVSPYNLGVPTDTGTDTICGCINMTLETILDKYLNVGKIPSIGVVTPTPWQTTLPASPESQGALYCDAIIQCCQRKSIPVLDLYRCSNLHPDNETFRTLAYSKDNGNGVHPDEAGHKIISLQFEEFLNKLL